MDGGLEQTNWIYYFCVILALCDLVLPWRKYLRLNFYGHIAADGHINCYTRFHICIPFIYLAKTIEMLLNVRNFNLIPISCSRKKTSTNTNPHIFSFINMFGVVNFQSIWVMIKIILFFSMKLLSWN